MSDVATSHACLRWIGVPIDGQWVEGGKVLRLIVTHPQFICGVRKYTLTYNGEVEGKSLLERRNETSSAYYNAAR
jgi:hypothetical protein